METVNENIVHGPIKYDMRGGVVSSGHLYEDSVTLQWLLTFLENKYVHNYWISREHSSAGAFEDIVVRLQFEQDGNIYNRLILAQLKHRENKTKMTDDVLITLFMSHFKSFKQIKKNANTLQDPVFRGCDWEDFRFVIFTNASCRTACGVQTNQFIADILKIGGRSQVVNLSEETHPEIFRKCIKSEFCVQDDPEDLLLLKEYFGKLLIFANQSPVNGLREIIADTLDSKMGNKTLVNNALRFIQQRFHKGIWLTKNPYPGELNTDILFQDVINWHALSPDIKDKIRIKFWLHKICQKDTGEDMLSIGRTLPKTVPYYVPRKVNFTADSVKILSETGHFCVVINKNHENEAKIQGPSILYCKSREDANFTKLCEYSVLIFDGPTLVLSENLSNIKVPIILLSADPGMGKSIFFTYLAEQIKNNFPLKWVIRANLNDYTDFLNEIDSNFTSGDDITLEFLVLIAGVKPGSVQYNLFKYYLTLQSMVVLFLDGVDEVSPVYFDKVMSMILVIKSSYLKSIQLWISTRPVLKTELERELNVKSIGLEEFTMDDSIRFIKQYYGYITKSQSERFIELATCIVLSNLTLSIFPLFCSLLSEMYKNHAQECFAENEEIEVASKSKFELYNLFIEKMMLHYYREKKKQELHNVAEMDDYAELKKISLQNHSKAALLEVLTRNDMKDYDKLHDDLKPFLNKIATGQMKIGIIISCENGKPKFIHKTVAEYFVALWCLNNYEENIALIEHIVTKNTLIFEFFSWKYTVLRFSHQGPCIKHSSLDEQDIHQDSSHISRLVETVVRVQKEVDRWSRWSTLDTGAAFEALAEDTAIKVERLYERTSREVERSFGSDCVNPFLPRNPGIDINPFSFDVSHLITTVVDIQQKLEHVETIANNTAREAEILLEETSREAESIIENLFSKMSF